MGSASARECSAIAAATHGCANCSSKARPAPRKIAASRLMRQVMDAVPKMPAVGEAAAARTTSSPHSKASVEVESTAAIDERLWGRRVPRGREHWPGLTRTPPGSIRATCKHLRELHDAETRPGPGSFKRLRARGPLMSSKRNRVGHRKIYRHY